MSSPNKITFGNNPSTSYNINSGASFAYRSGQNLGSSYSPYNLISSSGQNPVTTTSYNNYDSLRQANYTTAYQAQPYSSTYSPVQANTPIGVSYQLNRNNVTYANPSTKVTFGAKNYTPTYTSPTRYQPNYQYTIPTPYQNYQTYQQPVQITPQPIQTNAIRQQTRIEQPKVQAVPEVRRSNVVVQNQPIQQNTKTSKTKTRKGGCPSWLWPLLGILALLALIVGLLFGLGVFGKIGGGAAPVITQGGKTNATTATNETVSGKGDSSTVAPTTTGGADAGSAAGTTTINGSTGGVTSPIGYTIIEETIILSKDKQGTTTPVTPVTPVTPITTPTIPQPTTPTVTPVTPTITPTVPTVPTVPTTTPTDDSVFEPQVFTPTAVPVATNTTTNYTTSTDYYPGSTTYPSSNNTIPTTTPTDQYSTYPTPSTL